MTKGDLLRKVVRQLVKEHLQKLQEFEEGPQPGDAEYHHSPSFPKGFGKFTDFDWESIFRGLVKGNFSKTDFLEIFSPEELDFLEDKGFIYDHDGTIIIDSPEYIRDFNKWYSGIKSAWLNNSKTEQLDMYIGKAVHEEMEQGFTKIPSDMSVIDRLIGTFSKYYTPGTAEKKSYTDDDGYKVNVFKFNLQVPTSEYVSKDQLDDELREAFQYYPAGPGNACAVNRDIEDNGDMYDVVLKLIYFYQMDAR